MIDGTLLTIIPPILASVLTYAVAMKRQKLVQLKTISEIQAKAIELVQKAEEAMRAELMKEIERIRSENEELKKKVEVLEQQRNASDQQAHSFKEEISTLRVALDHYKTIVEENKFVMEQNQKELDYLRKMSIQEEEKKRNKKR